MSYIVLDVETTIRSSFKRKGNPFDPLNWTVYVGEKRAQALPHAVRHHSPAESKGWLARVLSAKPTILAGHNIKFDILHGIAADPDGLAAWMEWVANGGIVWDTQTAEYLLNGMLPEFHMMSLDELAPLYGGVVKVDEVKTLWEQGVDTPDIPEDLLVRYLHGDVCNTELILLGQLKRARESGQMKSILLNMGAMLYVIEAERNGMRVDKELGLELAKELAQELAELSARLESHLPADLPFQFKWTSRHHKSALIFGGTVKYETKVPIFDENMKPVYYQRESLHYVLDAGGTYSKEYYDLEAAAGTPDLPSVAFFKSGKNEGQPKTKKVKEDDVRRGQKLRNEERTYTFPGFTQPSKQWETATAGVYSTAGEVITALGNRNIPFLRDLSKHAKVEKDLGTYFIKGEGTDATGMLTLVQPDGIIHHSINQNSTVTGRFSSSNPNLQNIPKGDKSKVKQVFRSRWPGGFIIQSDFTSLEIYIQAILTGDTQLIADLVAGLDMHCTRVAQAERVEYEFVVRMVADGVDEWKQKRTKAKVFSFQRAYGAGAALIAESTGMTRDEVDALIAAEEERYPQIEPFYARLTETIQGSRRGVRKTIPHPDWPAKLIELRTGYSRTPDNKLYAYIEQPSPKFVVERKGIWTGFSPTEIKNYVVQGTGAEFMKAAMWMLVRAMYSRKNFAGRACIVNTVHDASYVDAQAEVLLEVAALQDAALRAASTFMQWYFGWELPVHVPCETTYGPSMAEEIKMPEIVELSRKYQEELIALYCSP